MYTGSGSLFAVLTSYDLIITLSSTYSCVTGMFYWRMYTTLYMVRTHVQ